MHRQLPREAAFVDTEATAADSGPASTEPFPEVRDRARAERDVDIGIEREKALALRLRVTATDGDHGVGLRALLRNRMAEVRGKLRVRLLADRARVEDEHVGVVARGRLPQPELLEHALDPLRVVSVHLAAEAGDVVAPHRPKCTRRPVASSR